MSTAQQVALQRRHAISYTSIVGALINLVLSLLKMGVGAVGQSQALFADGIHSLSDLASDVLVFFAGRHAAQAPDSEHPYGHARVESVATLVLALLLAGVAIGIGWDATARLFDPQALLAPSATTLLAALVSIGVKEWLYWWTLGYAKRVGSELLRANAWHHRSDSISSIVVLAGILGTMAGLPYLDAIAAVIVAVMIIQIAWGLGWNAANELVDRGLEGTRLAEVRQTIRSVGGVRDIHLLRTRRYGEQATADVHVRVDPYISVSEGHSISVMVEQQLKFDIPEMTDVTVHIDPEDDENRNPCDRLPLRPEVLARLASLWSAIPAANERQRVILHYIGGKIDLEVYFPLTACLRSSADPAALAATLTSALGTDPIFGKVRLYFGDA